MEKRGEPETASYTEVTEVGTEVTEEMQGRGQRGLKISMGLAADTFRNNLNNAALSLRRPSYFEISTNY